MDPERRRLLRVRERRRKKFIRYDSYKKKRLGESWRRPRGLHNKMRKQIAAKGSMVKCGYGSPVKVRGLHPSGFEEVLVFNPRDLENVREGQAVRIASNVGMKKRTLIEKKAEEMGLKVLNPT
ncbi:MAG: 50S ribosomal protein L32e [Candidatus Syntropharchaeia archaeon]